MIQEFKIKNFLSFRDEVTLNFEATKDKTFEESQIVEVAPNVRLLRLVVLYGANASGKSNLLQAFNFLREFWFTKQDDMDEKIEAVPFLLDTETPKRPSEFELKFFVGNTKYWYCVSLDKKSVFLEKLYYYNSVQPTLLFSRTLVNGQSVLKFNSNAVKISNTVLEELTLKCLPNMSFFAARNKVNCSLPKIDEARDWMKNNILPIIDPNIHMFDYAGRKMLEDSELKNYILDFLHRADFNITGVNTEKKSEPMPELMRNILLEDKDLPKSAKDNILSNPVFNHINTDFEHTVKNTRGIEKYILPTSLQSQGTKRTFGIEAAIYKAIKNEEVLPIDEIESSLHPELIEFILEQFLKINSRSQLIVTTHYDPLLNTVDDLLRKDSIWFTEKEEDGNTNLYSLVEFKGLNKIRSFQKSYRNGVFGALPNIQA